MKIRDIGCVKIWLAEDESAFCMHPDNYTPILDAWMAGKAFYTGLDMFGEPLTVKLGKIAAIGRATPESVAQFEREKREQDAEDVIEGGA